MSNLFQINSVNKIRTPEKVLPVEESFEQKKRFSQDQQKFQESLDELEEKINTLVKEGKIIDSLDLIDFDSEARIKLLQIANQAASAFLKKELLSIARNALSLSLDNSLSEEPIDDDITFSEYLAKLIMKLSINKKSTKDDVKTKLGKTNPLEDKNAGFLVHYCKDILKNSSNPEEQKESKSALMRPVKKIK
ncbi:MAG: hypothetical protein WCT85_06675 [Parachlamydiales bacterium]|jgi:hypothetical protein